MTETPAHSFLRSFCGENIHLFIDSLRDTFSNLELAAVAACWQFWARAKQLSPVTDWRSWGFLTGRGFGKTLAISKYINDEVEAGRAMLICLIAQDESSAIAIQVLGPSGLIATAPPWNKPRWEATLMQLVWPNGARAYVRTPEVPGKIRGLEYHLAWASELQSWPAALRDEAFSNVLLSTRLGYARLVWDATPKRRHPILRDLLAQSEANPEEHAVVRGTTHENAANLGPGYVEELERKYGGTLKGREELLGEMLAESESALVRQEWIDKARRQRPDTFARKIVSVDPAITERKGSDNTGIILAGLGVDGQMLVLGDYSGKMAPSKWAEKTVDLYVRECCDCVVVETNKGGDMLRTVLKAFCADRGLNVVLAGKDEKPKHVPGVLYVKEVYAKGAKEDRAQPAATAYERGRISHAKGADLSSLEDTLTSWEPSPSAKSPGDLDALAHAAVELLDLASNKPDPKIGFEGVGALAAAVAKRGKQSSIATILGRGTGGRI